MSPNPESMNAANNKLADMLSVSGRTNYSSAKLAKHCNIRYLKDANGGKVDEAIDTMNKPNPYLNINETLKPSPEPIKEKAIQMPKRNHYKSD